MSVRDRAPSASSDVEQRTRAIAHQLAAGTPWWKRWFRLEEKLIGLVMANPVLRVKLFRLTEAFPAMQGPSDTLDHIVEYLGDDATPAWMRTPVRLAAKLPFAAYLAHRIARIAIGRMAHQFIAGTDASDAAPKVRKLWDRGIGVIVDALGEKTITDREADVYADRVLELVTGLGAEATIWPSQPSLEQDHHGPVPRVAIAIKPTALSAKFSPLTAETGIAQVAARLRPVLSAAVEHDVMVWFDMEHYAVKDMTRRLFRQLADEFPTANVGIVVQAYLTDSHDDLTELLTWAEDRSTPVGVRLVKGAYWDYETVVARSHGWPIPVYQRKVDTDANFERCTELLNHHYRSVRPAYASHNLRSLAHALGHAEAIGAPREALEVQTLQGMATDVPRTLAAMGVRSRVYLPVGELIPGMAYLVRRLLENTSNESFVRQQQGGIKALDQLLERPEFSEPVPPPNVDAA